MKLLYVCNDFGIRPDGVKGASIHLRAITSALAELGHEVHLLSPHGAPGGGHPARAVLAAGCPAIADTVRPLKQWLGAFGVADDLARDLRPLVFNSWASGRAQAALGANPPDVIIERAAVFSGLGADLAEAMDRPLVLEVNAPMTHEAGAYRTLCLGDLARQLEHRTLERADAVMAVSEPLASLLIQDGADPCKVHVVPNGVDAGVFAGDRIRERSREALGLNGEFVVGFTGSLKPWHGVEVLIRAFARLHQSDRDTRLLIVGTGPMHERLSALAGELGIKRAVIFTGAVPHDQVAALLSAMDAATAPYPAMEGFYFSPIKLFEYMAASLPVVGSRQGQVAQVIEHGRTGLLCEPGDVEGLAEALTHLKQSPALRAQLGRAARRTVDSQFTWRHTAQRVMDIIGGQVRCAASSAGGIQ